MTQRYTRTDGNDANTGLSNTAGGAYLTIKKLIAQTLASDVGTIVGPGTFTEFVNGNAGQDTINSGTSYADAPQFNVLGAPVWATPAGTGESFVLYNGQHHIIFTGLIFDGINQTESGTGQDQVSIGNATHHIRCSSCEFKRGIGMNVVVGGNPTPADSIEFLTCLNHDTRGTGARYHGLYAAGSTNILVSGGNYYNNRGSGVHLFSGDNSGAIVRNLKVYNNGLDTAHGANAAIVMGSGSNMLVYNCLVYDHNDLGIQVDFASSSHTGNKVLNNTLYNVGFGSSQSDPIQIGASAGALISGCWIKNNLIYLCANSNAIQDYSGSAVINNNFQSSVIDPIFLNLVGKDFHLTSLTPASILNAGATLTDFSTDFDGTSRPKGSAWDIGAYEYMAPVVQSSVYPCIVEVGW